MNNMLKSTKGFTLIELLVAIAILGVIITLMIDSKIGQQDQNITQQQAVEMQQSVRASVFLMSREIRSAGYNPEYRTYNVGITNAGANALTFNRVASDDGDDNDNDGTVDEDGELEIITYALQDSDGDGDNDITVAYNAGGANAIAEIGRASCRERV